MQGLCSSLQQRRPKPRRMKSLFTVVVLWCAVDLAAQHQHAHPGSSQNDTGMSAHMSHSFSLNLPMNRNGSGTGWMPDSSVMYGHGLMSEKWMFMFHANVFLRSNWQDIMQKGNRGGQKTDAPGWFMGMGQRRVGDRGLFRFSAMISIDPLTIGSEGYPLLFQTGETYKGQPLIDRQHPHDLFSELSIGYTHSFSEKIDLSAYLAYPGEPALGPVAFMHRNSALNNPDAPLGHHWQDATHITYGVATIGLRVGIIKVEGSVFTGREPDENRYDFDPVKFDSYSLRILCNPNEQLALQVSQALLISPEQVHPDDNVNRTTASVIHNLHLGANKYLATTLAWGRNAGEESGHSILIEPNLQYDRTALYGRYEWVEKSARDLGLNQFDDARTFNVQAFTLGVNHVILRKFGNNVAAGVQSSVFVSPELHDVYGKSPVSLEVYLRIYPHLMRMRHTKRI